VCNDSTKLCTPGGVSGGDPGASCLANGDCKSGQCQSNLSQVTEYDPDYESGGIRASTAAGDAGPAPIIFFNEPNINRVPPVPVALQSPDAYHKRGRVTDWNNEEQVQFGDFPGGLKDLATETPAVRQAMIDVYTRWADVIDFDGFRIDTVKHVEHDFWNVFCSAVRQDQVTRGKKQFIMFGEVFDGDDAKVGSYTQNSELDTTVNFPLKYQVFEDVVKNNVQPTSKFQTFWEGRAANYAAQPALNGPSLAAINVPFNFLDNHDVPRYLSDAPSTATLQQALFLLMTVPGVPMIYYGTEQGFTGANDPSNREDLSTSNYNQNHPLYLWIQQLTALRKKYEPLRHGTLEFRWTSPRQGQGEDIGIIAFTRTTASGAALVVLNTSDSGTSSTSFNGDAMQPGFAPNTALVDVIGGETYTVDAGGHLQLTLSARQNMLLVPQ
jgi:glycosidase